MAAHKAIHKGGSAPKYKQPTQRALELAAKAAAANALAAHESDAAAAASSAGFDHFEPGVLCVNPNHACSLACATPVGLSSGAVLLAKLFDCDEFAALEAANARGAAPEHTQVKHPAWAAEAQHSMVCASKETAVLVAGTVDASADPVVFQAWPWRHRWLPRAHRNRCLQHDKVAAVLHCRSLNTRQFTATAVLNCRRLKQITATAVLDCGSLILQQFVATAVDNCWRNRNCRHGKLLSAPSGRGFPGAHFF